MAKKQTAKPLLATKFDFVESLDAMIHRAVMLDQSLRIAFDLAKRGPDGALILPKAAADGLREQMDAFKTSMFTVED